MKTVHPETDELLDELCLGDICWTAFPVPASAVHVLMPCFSGFQREDSFLVDDCVILKA